MEPTTEVTLPLQPDVSRCLGHGDIKNEWCKKYNECARHQTISHANEPWHETKPPYYRACSSDNFHLFMEISE